jgi:hypothetical protein
MKGALIMQCLAIPLLLVAAIMSLLGCILPFTLPTERTTQVLPPELPQSVVSSSGTGTFVSSDTFEGAIFSAEQAAAQGVGLWVNASAEDYWTPEVTDVLAFEDGLVEFLQTSDHYAIDTILERLPEYKRQYVGLLEDGRRVLYANFFCDTFGYDWGQEFVSVADGGACFFQLRYDVETGRYFDLMVNGEA